MTIHLLLAVFLLFKNLINVFRKYKSSFESSWINKYQIEKVGEITGGGASPFP